MTIKTTGAADRYPELTRAVVQILDEVVPGLDLDDIDPTADMRYAFDIDSIDFLNLMIGIDERLGVDVPETDYGDITTLDGLVAYLANRGAVGKL